MDILHSVHGYNHIQNEYNVIRIIRYEYDAFQSNYSFERIVVNKRMNNMDQKKEKKKISKSKELSDNKVRIP